MLRSRLPAGWRIRIQSAISTADSEPVPDLAVVQGNARQRTGRHPGAQEIGLLIEVAESSLERDRAKRRIYAAAGVGLYWIVNLVDSCIEVYSSPVADAQPAGYTDCNVYKADDAVQMSLQHGGRAIDIGSVSAAKLLP